MEQYIKSKTSKICSLCQQELSLDKFSLFKSKSKYYTRGQCKACRVIINRKYYYLNKEAVFEYKKLYHEKNIDSIHEYDRERYYKNKTKILTYAQQYRLKNKETLLKRSKTVPYKFTQYKSAAKKRNLVFALNISEFKSIFNSSCSYCGISPSHGVDRVNNNQGYIASNCVGCCAQCNRMKGTLSVTEFQNHIVKMYKKLIANNKVYLG